MYKRDQFETDKSECTREISLRLIKEKMNKKDQFETDKSECTRKISFRLIKVNVQERLF